MSLGQQALNGLFGVRIAAFAEMGVADAAIGIDQVVGWRLDAAAQAEIDRILDETITDPVGPEFMAPPTRSLAA